MSACSLLEGGPPPNAATRVWESVGVVASAWSRLKKFLYPERCPTKRKKLPWHVGIEEFVHLDPEVNLKRLREEFRDKDGQFELSL